MSEFKKAMKLVLGVLILLIALAIAMVALPATVMLLFAMISWDSSLVTWPNHWSEAARFATAIYDLAVLIAITAWLIWTAEKPQG